jgi:alpha-amylase
MLSPLSPTGARGAPPRVALLLGLLAVGAGLAAGAPADSAGIDTSAVPQLEQPSALPAGWQHGAFMEVFVRAYKDSNGDGVGDIKGLTQQLDYLKDLGIKGIWLMPITANADGDHGYTTTDFRAIDPGPMARWTTLTSCCARRTRGASASSWTM